MNEKFFLETLFDERCLCFDYQKTKKKIRENMWTYSFLSIYSGISVPRLKQILNGKMNLKRKDAIILKYLAEKKSPQKIISEEKNVSGIDQRTLRRFFKGKTIKNKAFFKIYKKGVQVLKMKKLLQSYKTNLCKGLGYRVSLFLENGEICFEKSSGTGGIGNSFVPSDIIKAEEAFGVVVVVDKIFEKLDHFEKIVIFNRFINHDWEREGEFYKTISRQELAKKFGCTQKDIFEIEERSLRKLEAIEHDRLEKLKDECI